MPVLLVSSRLQKVTPRWGEWLVWMATVIYVEKIKFQWCFGVFTANICSSILPVLSCATEDTRRNDKVSGDMMCYGCSAHSGMEFSFWKLIPYNHSSLPFLPLILSSLHILLPLPFSLLFQLRRHFFEECLFCGNKKKKKFHATEPIFPRREQWGPIRTFSDIYLVFGPSSYKREGVDLCGFSHWWQYIEKGRNVKWEATTSRTKVNWDGDERWGERLTWKRWWD